MEGDGSDGHNNNNDDAGAPPPPAAPAAPEPEPETVPMQEQQQEQGQEEEEGAGEGMHVEADEADAAAVAAEAEMETAPMPGATQQDEEDEEEDATPAPQQEQEQEAEAAAAAAAAAASAPASPVAAAGGGGGGETPDFVRVALAAADSPALSAMLSPAASRGGSSRKGGEGEEEDGGAENGGGVGQRSQRSIFASPAASTSGRGGGRRQEGGGGSPGSLADELLDEHEGGGEGGNNGEWEVDEDGDPVAEEDQELVGAVIWGTTYPILTFVKRFRRFVRNFRLPRPAPAANAAEDESQQPPQEEEPHYIALLKEMRRTQEYSINLNCRHLWNYLPARRLYHVITHYPQETVSYMDKVLNEEYARVVEATLLTEARQARAQRISAHVQALVEGEGMGEQEARAEAYRVAEEEEGPVAARGRDPVLDDGRRIQVRLFNLRRVAKMRDLNPEDVDHLVALRGMVIRCSGIIPDLTLGCFRCFMCGYEAMVENDRGRVEEPQACENCQAKECMELVANRCEYSNKQIVRMQETPDEIPEGETPTSLTLFAYDDLTDAVRPGDRIEVTGILRAAPRRIHPRLTTVRSVYKTHVEALHFAHIDKDLKVERGPGEGTGAGAPANAAVAAGGANAEGNGAGALNSNLGTSTTGSDTARQRGFHLPPERVAEIKRLARDPMIYEKLAAAVAPSIWEMDDVKKGVLCLLFGGTDKKPGSLRERKRREKAEKRLKRAERRARRLEVGLQAGGFASDDEEESEGESEGEEEEDEGSNAALNCRGDINILLCGDPGTSKSQILLYVHKLAPRGIYTSGKGSSAVGLTASVIRDAETKELVLESGALVLSDQGICCIDEFDKMSEATRAILHEAMEQQTVSIAKAGIICTLNARTSILASANPVDSRYNPRLSVVENIRLPPTLLSRFDLIYLILDTPDEDKDRRLAKHLVSLYYPTPAVEAPQVDHAFLKDYIAYARAHVHPVLSEEAGEQLVQSYLALRGSGGGEGKTITATPRQLESLIRLSEALAKVRLSSVVEKRDVEEAMRLMAEATLKAATDPETGRLDMGNLDGTSRDREAREQLAAAVKEYLASRKGQRLSVSEIRHGMQAQSDVDVKQGLLVEVLRKELEPEGVIKYLPATHTVVVQ